jgi:hypothetical protein
VPAEFSDFTDQAINDVTPHGKVNSVTDFDLPATGSARVHVLPEGYVGLDGDAVIAALKASRSLLLSMATVIIPGHGAPSHPGAHA